MSHVHLNRIQKLMTYSRFTVYIVTFSLYVFQKRVPRGDCQDYPEFYLVLNLVTCLYFPFFGIIGIYYAILAIKELNRGNFKRGKSYTSWAENMCFFPFLFVIGALMLVMVIFGIGFVKNERQGRYWKFTSCLWSLWTTSW